MASRSVSGDRVAGTVMNDGGIDPDRHPTMRTTRNGVHARLLALFAGIVCSSSLPASAQNRAENRLERTEARETRQGARLDRR